jgi:lipoyl(octanoyl) transferase
VRRGASFHGMAFNVAMDLEPFGRINPCGFANLEVTDLRSLGVTASLSEVRQRLDRHLQFELRGGA